MMEPKCAHKDPEARHVAYGFWLYLVCIAIFNALIFATPLLLSSNSELAPPLYSAFAVTCHQLDSRSLCYFPSSGSIVSDCTPQNGELRYERTEAPSSSGRKGFKIPVCSRDIAIYLAMLAGGVAWPFVKKMHSRRWPPLWFLIAAIAPTAIDGTTQLVGFRESSNSLRLATGAIMGIVLPFYIIPMLNEVFWFLNERK